jgi:hypothetical protein
VFGEEVEVERVGTDGDMEKAIALIKQLDGKVDAFGMGGIDLYVVSGNKRYMFREARRIAKAAQKTPIVDGSGLKNTLERLAVKFIQEQNLLSLKGKKVLLMSGVDRFGMAEALSDAGCEMVFGDLLYAVGIPLAIRSLKALHIAATCLAPIIVQLPFSLVYPTGKKQEQNTPKHTEYYDWADIIAGDFHFIKRYMPARLDGKVILTNTVTGADVEDLKERGVSMLITTTPNLEGRSFGTNVMEALIVSLAGKPADSMRPEDYIEWLEKLNFAPRVEHFEREASANIK